MNPWIRFAILLWLAIALIIVAISVVHALDSQPQVTQFQRGEFTTVDGGPASIFDEYEHSVVKRAGTPIWKRRVRSMILGNITTGAQLKPEDKWTVVAIDKPFHLTFLKPDGTRTKPMEVNFGTLKHEAWKDDGLGFTSIQSFGGYPSDERMLRGRAWNWSVVRQVAIELAGMLAAIGFGAVLLTCILNARWRAKHGWNPLVCRHCGYDLSGCTVPGCPECGADRPRSA